MTEVVSNKSPTRWPHDMYNEHKNARYPSPSRERYRKEESFMSKRRKQREKITLLGVPQVWGVSPEYVNE